MAHFAGRALFALAMTCAALAVTPEMRSGEKTEPASKELLQLQDKARRLLASDKPADRAWGAWYASKHNLADLSPEIEKRLEQTLNQSSTDSDSIVALIDALIVNKHKPNPALLQALRKSGYRAEAIVWSAVDAKESMSFLETLPPCTSNDFEDIAAANLFMTHAPLSFVNSIKHKLELTLIFDVKGMETLKSDVRVRRISRRRGLGYEPEFSRTFISAPEWPPHIEYALSSIPQIDDIIVVCGPKTVYGTRRIYVEPSGFLSRSNPINHKQDRPYWVECLFHMAYGESDAESRNYELDKLRFEHSQTLFWCGPQGLRYQAVTSRNEAAAPWRALLSKLHEKGFVEGRLDLDKRISVKTTLLDRRIDKQTPLPAVEDLYILESGTPKQ